MEFNKNTHAYALELETAFRLGEVQPTISADMFEINFAEALENAISWLWGNGYLSEETRRALLDYAELGQRLDEILSTSNGQQQITYLINRVKKEKAHYAKIQNSLEESK